MALAKVHREHRADINDSQFKTTGEYNLFTTTS